MMYYLQHNIYHDLDLPVLGGCEVNSLCQMSHVCSIGGPFDIGSCHTVIYIYVTFDLCHGRSQARLRKEEGWAKG